MHIIPSTVIHPSWTLWHVWVTTCHSFRIYNYLFMHLSHRTSYNISLRVTGYNKTIFHTARQPQICNIGQHTRHMTLMSHGCHGISNRWQFHYVFNKLFIPKTKENWTPLLSICEWIYRSPVDFDKKWVTSVRGMAQGLFSLRKCRLTGIRIPIINVRRSDDRLRFIMGIPILIRRPKL